MALQPYQQRAVDEKVELDDKLAKLMVFVHSPAFAVVDREERDRMIRQAGLMKGYSDVLGERIAAFQATEVRDV